MCSSVQVRACSSYPKSKGSEEIIHGRMVRKFTLVLLARFDFFPFFWFIHVLVTLYLSFWLCFYLIKISRGSPLLFHKKNTRIFTNCKILQVNVAKIQAEMRTELGSVGQRRQCRGFDSWNPPGRLTQEFYSQWPRHSVLYSFSV
jgi:hypothetical protein